MRLALYEPDIPQNTGTILRLAACLGLGVDLIEPLGFQFDDKRLKRASLDYIRDLDIQRHRSFDRFLEAQRRDPRHGGSQPDTIQPDTIQSDTIQHGRIVLLTAHAPERHVDFSFQPNDVLLLGRESAGAPEAVHAAADARVGIPLGPGMRSLNVALAAAMVAGEALRQTGGFAAAPAAGWPGNGAANPRDDADPFQSEEGQSP